MTEPLGHPADEPGPMAFVIDLDRPALAEADAHHLARVVRLREGDALTLADGAGRWRTATFGVALSGLGRVHRLADAPPPITIGFALVKGDKPELVVQKLTEMGVDRIVPFRAERSVVRWDQVRATKAVARLRSVARAAAQQCHRPRLPMVDEVTDLGALVAAGAALADRHGAPPSLAAPFVLVGPEGGWAPEEAALGAPRVALGAHVLRAETAALTAGAVLAALRGGLVGPGR